MSRYVTTNLRLEAATYEELKLRASRQGVGIAGLVREAVARYLGRADTSALLAVAVAREFLRSKRYELVFIDSAVLDGALERMNRFADKRLSLADCASMELIDRLRLGGAVLRRRGSGLTTTIDIDRAVRAGTLERAPALLLFRP